MKKPEIFQLLSKAYFQQKMFESILFEGSNQEQLVTLVNQICQFLYCDNHRFEGDDCQNCLKFNQHQILDFYQIGDGFLAINKETLKTTLDDLEQTARNYGQPKVLLLANVENLKLDAANSLLKFLEEPTQNTFLFLLTRNKNDVLPTIKSRTKIISLDDLELVSTDNFLITTLLSKKSDQILLLNNKLKKLDKEELINLLQQNLQTLLAKNYLQLYQLSLELINDLKFDANASLAIDRFLIGASGVSSWKF